MCFGVRFSLYLASWLSDFDHFFLCVVFGPLVFPPENGGGGARPAPGFLGISPEASIKDILVHIRPNNFYVSGSSARHFKTPASFVLTKIKTRASFIVCLGICKSCLYRPV